MAAAGLLVLAKVERLSAAELRTLLCQAGLPLVLAQPHPQAPTTVTATTVTAHPCIRAQRLVTIEPFCSLTLPRAP